MKPTSARSPDAAREAVTDADGRNEPFSLLVCDAAMPEEDGFALVSDLLKSEKYDGPVVMMFNSVDRPGDAARCRELGVEAYLAKPVRQSDLFNAIMLALGMPVAAEEEIAIGAQPAGAGVRSLRVLLAEDNEVNQQVAVRMLEKRGHRVVVAGDGKTAIDHAADQEFDVILMDVQMPEMGGFEATAAIRERERSSGEHVPIIAMTAHTLKGDRERCLEAGMDGYVGKPISAAALFDEFARLLPDAATPVGPDVDDEDFALDGDRLYDRAAALARIDGDEKLLDELAGLFLEEYPKQRAIMREAIKNGELETLKRTAHALRGALGNFYAHRAVKAVQAVEDAAQQGEADAAGRAMKELAREIDRLKPHLIGKRKERDE
jgi:CheY-like chemotaxis protein